jgi:hypothetical protein
VKDAKAASGLRAAIVASDSEEDRMDDDTFALARQLFSRAGMILEDVSATAILVGDKGVYELRAIACDLRSELEKGARLIDAAHAIIHQPTTPPSNSQHSSGTP